MYKRQELYPAGISEDELLELAAYAENYSTHPIAESIREAYRERKGSLAEAETQKANAGTAEIVLDADNDTIKEVQSKEGVQLSLIHISSVFGCCYRWSRGLAKGY